MKNPRLPEDIKHDGYAHDAGINRLHCLACLYIQGYNARSAELRHDQNRYMAEQKAEVGL
jgi:hypothetical protein